MFRLQTEGFYIYEDYHCSKETTEEEQMSALEFVCDELFGSGMTDIHGDKNLDIEFPCDFVDTILHCTAPSESKTWGNEITCYWSCRHLGLLVEHMSATRVLKALSSATSQQPTIAEKKNSIGWIVPQDANLQTHHLIRGHFFLYQFPSSTLVCQVWISSTSWSCFPSTDIHLDRRTFCRRNGFGRGFYKFSSSVWV